jgi:hypothetical protein
MAERPFAEILYPPIVRQPPRGVNAGAGEAFNRRRAPPLCFFLRILHAFAVKQPSSVIPT